MTEYETRFARNEKVVAADMGGETVMMDVDKGVYLSLNATGTQIWEALAKPASLPEITQKVREAFDVSAAGDLDAQVSKFVSDLKENGLITEVK
ncbi:MAG: PqqD family peptide modification chaperone [Pseudomonadota bacterium]